MTKLEEGVGTSEFVTTQKIQWEQIAWGGGEVLVCLSRLVCFQKRPPCSKSKRRKNGLEEEEEWAGRHSAGVKRS